MTGTYFDQNGTILAVFAREPVERRVKTRLAKTLGARAALELYRALLADTVGTVAAWKGGNAVWWVDGDPERLFPHLPERSRRRQPGGGLGERLALTFDTHFSEGAQRVGVIGTDCPGLKPGHLDALFGMLRDGCEAAAIPARDGGFCALALSRPVGGLFEGVRWSCPDTLSDLEAKLAGAGVGFAKLAPLGDVDEEADLAPAALESDGAFSALARTYGLSGDAPKAVVDDLGRVVELYPPPRRIVSLVPSVTETLLDWGLGERVVGRTDFCISPMPEVDRLPCVGGPKTLDVDGVLALAPDLVFADAEENDRARVEALMAARVRVFVALPRTLADVASFLHRAARLAGVAPPDQGWLEEFKAPPDPTERAVCLVWLDPPMGASSDTLPGALMEAAGFYCAARTGEGPRYPTLTWDELRALAPRHLLLPSEPYPFEARHLDLLKEICPAAQGLLFPGEWVTWYSSRTPMNLAALRRLPRVRELG